MVSTAADPHTTDVHNGEKANHSCKICGDKCTTRCSLCRKAYYCSIDCQRLDWKDRGHRNNCPGNKDALGGQCRRNRRRPRESQTPKAMNHSQVLGPSPPPLSTVRNETEAQSAMEELWSIASGAAVPKQEGSSSVTTTSKSKEGGPAKPTAEKRSYKTLSTTTAKSATKVVPVSSNQIRTSFVVEEMPQISRFQLTLRRYWDDSSTINNNIDPEPSILITTEPLGPSGSRTLVIIREEEKAESSAGRTLFVGEFPRQIEASNISWNAMKEEIEDSKGDTSATIGTYSTVLVFRLPYPYDPSIIATTGGAVGSTSTQSSVKEINGVLCGSCLQPLLQKQTSKATNVETENNPTISRVFPLPLGHWDEIADYLICYDGQPFVDLSAGSECAEPSIALQNSSLLCLHQRAVEQAVCALAVDGYGELAERATNNKDTETDDLGTFGLPPSAAFSLPTPQESNTNKGEKEDVPESDEKILPSSAVIRGDRIWKDAADGGDSVSLCCGRCCSPLGFASLTSPETWRFWKHRLALSVSPPPTAKALATSNTDCSVGNGNSNNDNPSRTSFNPSLLPCTTPLGSCSSFLARELVRYAESKAIFTFVVRCEDMFEKSNTNDGNKCLLLRLLSWETTMATSFHGDDDESSPHRLRFQTVAKIVFEETINPTAKKTGHGTNDHEPTQWFWGGIDLCCPPANGNPTTTDTTNTVAKGDEKKDNDENRVSTVRLQLPKEEYDRVLADLQSGRSCFQKDVADATIMLKMGGLWNGLGLTAVVL